MSHPRVYQDTKAFFEEFKNNSETLKNGATLEGSPTIDGALPGDGLNIAATYTKTVFNIKTIRITLTPNSTTEQFLDLDGGTTYLDATSGTIAANGVTSPTIYVDGAVSSTLTAGVKQTIHVTTATDIDVTSLAIGKVGATYFNGDIHKVELFRKEFSAEEVSDDYEEDTYSEIDYADAYVYLPMIKIWDDGTNWVTENLGTQGTNWILGDGSTESTFPTAVPGGKGFLFDESNSQYITYPSSNEFDSVRNQDNFSVSVGISDMNNSNVHISCKLKDGKGQVSVADGVGWDILHRPGISRIDTRFRDNSGATSLVQADYDAKYKNIFLTLSFHWSDGAFLYVNGRQIGSDNLSNLSENIDAAGPVRIGTTGTALGNFMDGRMQDYSYFKQSLTLRQHKMLYDKFRNEINI